MTRTRKTATILTLGVIGMIAGMTAASAGGGCHSGTVEARGTRVEMIGACFTPTTLFAAPGEAITFVNRDNFAHNITANDWGNFDDMREGESYTMITPKVDGVYAYACSIHPGMSGAIVVGEGDSGSAAVVGSAEPLAASSVPDSDGDGWIATGAAGLVIGAAAGTGIAAVRRRATGA